MALTQDQATAQATAQYQPTYNLGLQGLDQNALDINQNYDTLGKTLADQANKSQSGLLEKQNQLGLLQSGLTSSGLGDIQKNLNTSTTQNEQQRASRLANIALQRAGLTTKYNSDIQSAVQQLLAPPKTTQLDLGGSIAEVDANGNIIKQYTKTAAPRVASSSSVSTTPTLKTASGSNFKVTPTILTQTDKLMQSVPSDNSSATGNNDKYFSQNELNQATKKAMAQYGLDQATAEQLIQQTIDARGYTVLGDWNSYTPQEQQAIIAGTY